MSKLMILFAILLTILLSIQTIAASEFDALWQCRFRQDLPGNFGRIESIKSSSILSSKNRAFTNRWINIGPEGGAVWSIASMASKDVIFLGTHTGLVFKSGNGGQNWEFNWMDKGKSIGPGIITSIQCIGDTVFIGGVPGLYKSTDSGQNWQALFFQSGILTAIAIHPSHPETIYIGYDFPGFNFVRKGVLKSTNGGKTWNTINVGLLSTDVLQIKISEQNPEMLYAATRKGAFMTTDAGNSGWKNITGNLPDVEIHTIVVDNVNDSIMYVGTPIGIFKTTDQGKNWQDITGSQFKNRFIMPNSLAILDRVVWVGTQQGLYQSVDGGSSWSEKVNGLGNTAILAIEMINQNQIHIGAQDGFYQSTTGGEFWQKSNQGLYGFNNTALAFDSRTSPARLLVGTDGAGMYASDDVGLTWHDLAMDSGFTSIFSLALQPDSQEVIFGSWLRYVNTADYVEPGLFRSVNSGKNWQKSDAGMENNFSFSLVFDPFFNQVIYAGTGTGVYKSLDSGLSWLAQNQGLDVPYVSRLVVDPINLDILYAGTATGNINSNIGIYKTTDAGAHWYYASDSLPSQRRKDIADICINPLNSQTIYAALTSAGVYKSVNGGSEWEKINEGIDDPYIFSITMDAQDTNRIYCGGFKIYQSDNAGQTWQPMMTGLPENFSHINFIRVDPLEPGRIYAASSGSGVLTFWRDPTSIAQEPVSQAPKGYHLDQNYPNPFNAGTMIGYRIPSAEKVTISIYNSAGQRLRTLIHDHPSAGQYTARWDGLDESGRKVTSGIYFYQIIAGNFTNTQKMILLQ